MSFDQDIFDVAIIGGGAAGMMAYLRAILNGDKAVLFTGDTKTAKQARVTWISELDNMPGFHDTMYPLTRANKKTLAWIQKHPHLKHLQQHYRARVHSIVKEEDAFTLHFHCTSLKDQHIRAKHIILATGVMDIQPLIKGSIEPIFPYANRNDLLYCIRCDGHRVLGHDISVIGHSNAAIYIGAILKERYNNKNISILTHGQKPDFSEDALALAKAYAFKIHSETIIDIFGDPKKEGLQGFVLEGGKVIDCTRSIVALGTLVYNDLAKQLGVHLADNDRIPVNQSCETNIPNVFAIGDLINQKKMQIYTAWDEAVDAADEINRRIRMKKREQVLKSL